MEKEAYAGLTLAQLIDAAVLEGLHYNSTSRQGLLCHLLGSVTDHGKLGMVSIGASHRTARVQYEAAVAALDRATR